MSKRLGLNLIKVTDTEMLSSFPHCMNIDYRLKAIKVMEKKKQRMLPKRVLARLSVSAGTVSERSDLETLSVLQEQTLNAASLNDVQRESEYRETSAKV